jgi:hypothetical protein
MRNPEIVAAILAGSALIALGLYFGLRGQERTPVNAPASSLPVVSPAAATPSPSTPPLAAPPATPAGPSRAEVLGTEARVEKAVAAARPKLKTECWDPSAKKNPAPASVKLTFNVSIGPRGKPISWGVSEHREATRSDIIDCVTRELGKIEVAPPSQPVVLDVDFELP